MSATKIQTEPSNYEACHAGVFSLDPSHRFIDFGVKHKPSEDFDIQVIVLWLVAAHFQLDLEFENNICIKFKNDNIYFSSVFQLL